MGVQVSVAARGGRDDLLPMLDGAMRDALLSDLEAEGVEILTNPVSNPGALMLKALVDQVAERDQRAPLLGGALGWRVLPADLGMEELLEAEDVTKLKALPLLENRS